MIVPFTMRYYPLVNETMHSSTANTGTELSLITNAPTKTSRKFSISPLQPSIANNDNSVS